MPTRTTAFPLLLIIAAMSFVLAGHFWMIDSAGSPVPIHDQWQAEAEFIYLPAVEHRLTTDNFFLPHAQHRIVPTRLLAYALFELNDRRWDVRLQMTVNAFVCAALAGVVVQIGRRFLSGWALVLFAAVFGGLLASPLFYGNALWGFQSQFYFLLLFSCLHLWLVTTRPVLSVGWTGGVICSALACLSMGSGFFSALVAVGLHGKSLIAPGPTTSRQEATVNLIIHLTIVAIAVTFAPAVPLAPSNWGNVLHTFLHCLGWPAFFFHAWGFWIWLPFAAFLCTAIKRQNDASRQLLLSIGLWVLLQVAAISWARNTPAIVITPRYYEILLMGLVANVFALAVLIEGARQSGRRRLFATVSFAAGTWCVIVTFLACRFADSHRRQDLSSYRTFARSQVESVRSFLATDNDSTLRSAPYPMVPHPDAEYLARMLRHPSIRAMLPTELNDQPPPSMSRVAEALRSSMRWWAVVGLGALAGASYLAASRRSMNGPTPPISR